MHLFTTLSFVGRAVLARSRTRFAPPVWCHPFSTLKMASTASRPSFPAEWSSIDITQDELSLAK